jgi:hypothetical protein
MQINTYLTICKFLLVIAPTPQVTILSHAFAQDFSRKIQEKHPFSGGSS